MTPQQAAERYHWCKYDKDTNTVELFLDHFMLSSLRICEAKFYLDHIMHIKPRYAGGVRKPWFFDFGEYIHWCLEGFYNHFKKYKEPPKIDLWLNVAHKKWIAMNMDGYKNSFPADQKKYEEVKGWEGVASLLVQYFVFYMDMRLRVIDTEITFGHNREVKIGEFEHRTNNIILDYEGFAPKVKCYLTGRIDLLVDNGYKIGPVDHKTTHRFDGFEHQDFNPQDAMTGYILAINDILKSYQGMNLLPQACMGGWIFHISSTTPSTPRDKSKKQGPRFKATPLDKTPSQMSDFKARQLSTFKRVADLLFNDKTPEWNTMNCNNMFFRACEYKPIHEQPSEEWPSIIQRFYTIGENVWDTRNGENKEKADQANKID